MVTDKAKHKAGVLSFWEHHGLAATLDAFRVKRSTLFLWKKKLKEGKGRLESLNDKSRAPEERRKRLWPLEIIQEVKRIRQEHPNLGKDKIYPFLLRFCKDQSFNCPSPSTIGRIIADCGGLRIFPKKISPHTGKVKAIKRKKTLRKPRGLKAEYPGDVCALDTIELFVSGLKRYVITFTDTYSRFAFAWGTKSKASRAAKEFFEYCRLVFPYPVKQILTDNGSEFAREFSAELEKLCITHHHTYPRRPQENPFAERYNRTIQEEYIDYHLWELWNPDRFNQGLIKYLLWYNTERPHWSLDLKSPLEFLINQEAGKSNLGWTDTGTGKI